MNFKFMTLNKVFAFLILFTIFLLIYLSLPAKALAATYYVAGDVGDDSRTTTQAQDPDTPWLTIQKAANNVSAGDTVNIKGGLTYSGTNTCGFFNHTVCLIKSGTSANYITYQPWSGTGIPTIEGPSNGVGIGVNVFSSGVNYNKIFGFIIKNTIYGVAFGGTGNIVANNIIYDESSISNSLGIYCLISEASTTYVYNNTIFQKYFGFHTDKGSATLKNNIIVNSTSRGISYNSGCYVSLTVDYNNVYNSTEKDYGLGLLPRGGHDLSLDPDFEDQDNYDFRLKSTSSLIDAGTTLSDVTTGILGTARPQGNAYDMGAYESNYSQANPPNATATPNYTQPSNHMTELAIYTGEVDSDGNTQFGIVNLYSTITLGDINEDGYDDLVVGARQTDPNGGAYIFLGKGTPTDTNAINADIILRGPAGHSFSDPVSLGDIDNDGHLELLTTHYNSNTAYIFKTGPSFSSRTYANDDATISGTGTFGSGASIIGDVNGDGFDDYIIDASSGKKTYLFYGSATLSDKSYTQADVTYTRSSSSDIFFTRPGDINNDGYKDIVIGARSLKAVYIFYGGTSLSDKNLTEADVILSSSEVYFGKWVALADINKDGYDDILSITSSRTYVFYGSVNLSSKTTANADVVLTAEPAYIEATSLGLSVTGADINNDGYLDVITSNHALPRAYVFYGGPSLSTKMLQEQI